MLAKVTETRQQWSRNREGVTDTPDIQVPTLQNKCQEFVDLIEQLLAKDIM